MYQVNRTSCGGILLQLAGTGEECGKERCVIAKGKYQDWITKDGLLLVKGWARDGLKDTDIAEKMGISTATFYAWQKDHPEFSEALKEGKAPVDIELEDSAFNLARGLCTVTETVTEVRYEGLDENGNPIEVGRTVKTFVKQVPPNATMQVFLLKNRRPDKYREKREEQIQVTQADYSLLDGIQKTVNEDEPEGDPDE